MRERLAGELAAAFRMSTIERDGRVVGFWCVTSAARMQRGDLDLGVVAAMRTERGRYEARHGVVTPHAGQKAHRLVVNGFGHGSGALARMSFEGAVLALVDLAGPGRWQLAARRRAAMARFVACGAPGIDPASLHAVVMAAEAVHPRALADYLGTLDPGALAVLADRRISADALDGRYAELDGIVTPGAPLRVALAAHPLSWRTTLDLSKERPDEFPGIVGRGSLVAALAAREGCDPAVYRAVDEALSTSPAAADLVSAGARRAWQGHPTIPGDLASMARCLPRDWMPGDAHGWVGLLRCMPALDIARDWLRAGWLDPADMARMVNSGGCWDRYVGRLSAAAGGADRVGPMSEGFDDVVRSLAAQVVAPAAALAGRDLSDAVLAARALLAGNRSCATLVETSSRWHRDLSTMRAALARLPGRDGREPDAWPAGLPGRRFGGVRVVVLATAAALADEGRRGICTDGSEGLDHCVGEYVAACRAGAVRIVSLRDAVSGERLSTAELDLAGGGVAVAQHRARGNADPSDGAVHALDRYLAWLGEDPTRVDRATLRAFPGQAGAPGPLDPARAGYDAAVPGNWEAARDAWSRHLPRAVRCLGPTDLAEVAAAAGDPSLGWRHAPRAWLARGTGQAREPVPAGPTGLGGPGR